MRALNNLFVCQERLTCSTVLRWWGGEVRGEGGDQEDGRMFIYHCKSRPYLLCGVLAAVVSGRTDLSPADEGFILIFPVPYFLLVNKTNLANLTNISGLRQYFDTDEVALSSSVEPSANNRTKTGSNILLYNRVPKCGSTFLKQLLRKLGKIFNIIQPGSAQSILL